MAEEDTFSVDASFSEVRSEERTGVDLRICRLWLTEFEPTGPKPFSDVATGNEG